MTLNKSEYSRNYSLQFPIRRLLSQAKHRAKKKGLDFDLVELDVVIPTHCPALGLELTKGGPGAKRCCATLPSLDRIDNTKGYTKDNVRVISHRANSLKRDATLEELKLLVSYLECA